MVQNERDVASRVQTIIFSFQHCTETECWSNSNIHGQVVKKIKTNQSEGRWNSGIVKCIFFFGLYGMFILIYALIEKHF